MLMRVVVIDDSAVAREAISRTLAFDPQIQVVGQAANANEARQIVRELNPDVITLDLEMPGMDGLGFLRNLMRLRPTPVVIISQHEEHDQEIREAMDLGALGYFPKHSLNLKPDSPQAETLRSRVRNAKDGLRQQPTAAAQPPSISSARFNSTVIGIGVSTGGLTTLPDLLAALPSSTPPIILVQHISAPLSGGLVARIQQHTSLEVRWGSQGQSLTPSTIFVAQAGRHLVVNSTPESSARQWHLELKPPQPEDPHCPAVDPLFRSLAKSVGAGSIGVLLTGMGQDGAAGLLDIRMAGGATVVQDPDSCVVKSMPSNAIKLGAAQHILTPEQIGQSLEKLWNRLFPVGR
jgi:two-component system chemotaxis response regulator CheB